MIRTSLPAAPCRSAGRGRQMGLWQPLGLLLLVVSGTAACDSLFEPTPPRVETFEAVMGGFRTGPPEFAATHQFIVYARDGERPRFHVIDGMVTPSPRPPTIAGDELLTWVPRNGFPVDHELAVVDLRTMEVSERIPRTAFAPPSGDSGTIFGGGAMAEAGTDTFLAAHWGHVDTLPHTEEIRTRGVAVVDLAARRVIDVLEPIRVSLSNLVVVPPSGVHPAGLWVIPGAVDNQWGRDSELYFVDPESREVVRRVLLEEAPLSRGGTVRRLELDKARRQVVGRTSTGLLFRASLIDGSVTFLPRPPGPLEIAIAPDGELFSVMVTDGMVQPGGGIVFRHPPELAGGYEVFADLREALSVVERSEAESSVLTDIAVSRDGSRVYVTAGGSDNLRNFRTHPAVLVVLDRYTGELLAEHELGFWGFPWIGAL